MSDHEAQPPAWKLIQAIAASGATLDLSRPGQFRLEGAGRLVAAARGTRAELCWDPRSGWRTSGESDCEQSMLDLYLPVATATAERPLTIAHLGQSLDGFIATPSGDSSFVTGPENIRHLHRLRALCDAVIVGAGTVSADNPRLTTRLVPGPSPTRVILDAQARLPASHTVFSDGAAPTLRVVAAGNPEAAESHPSLVTVPAGRSGLHLGELIAQLRQRGFSRILIEGGGVTVSSFLQADLIDRLHIAVAPILIGDGRPALRLPAQRRLQDCLRLRTRVYRSGRDILFDCDLRASPGPADDAEERLDGAGPIRIL